MKVYSLNIYEDNYSNRELKQIVDLKNWFKPFL